MTNRTPYVDGVTFLAMTEVRMSTTISPTLCVKARLELHVTEVDDLDFMSKVLSAVNSMSLPDVRSGLRTPNDCLVFFSKQLEPVIQKMTLLPVCRSIELEVVLKELMGLTRKILIRNGGLPLDQVGDKTTAEELTLAWNRYQH